MPHYEDYNAIKDYKTNENIQMLARIIGEMSIYCGYLEVTKDNYRTIQKRIKTWSNMTGSKPLMNTKTKEGVHISISMVKAVIGLKMYGRWAQNLSDRQFVSKIKRIKKDNKRREALKCQV
tara:strand:+ start:122 stop:484 length:363 start_codon:yes stop_codon:yes gene_type:complete